MAITLRGNYANPLDQPGQSVGKRDGNKQQNNTNTPVCNPIRSSQAKGDFNAFNGLNGQTLVLSSMGSESQATTGTSTWQQRSKLLLKLHQILHAYHLTLYLRRIKTC